MVSLRDIAAECGVSVAAVSKALNGHSDIGAETKKRIIKKADDMGYVPNAAAKSLKLDRTYNLGVLFMDEAGSGLTHDYFSYVLEGFKSEAEKKGYDITFINNNNFLGRTSYLEHARFRRFDGVCIACIDFSQPEVLELVKSEIPVVTIDHIFNNAISVLSDNVGGMEELTRYVLDRGHRKIAYIHGGASSVTTARLTAFYRTMEEYGAEVPDDYVKEAAYRNTKEAYQRTMELLDLEEPPTCIMYSDDFASFGGMRAIGERGLRIPEDISVAGYDGLRLGRHIRPRLTTMRQNTQKIGALAAQKLVAVIENPKTTSITQYPVKGTIYEGESVSKLLPSDEKAH